MRKYSSTALGLVASLVLSTPAHALEKTAARMTDDTRTHDWDAGATCTVVYYNICTGWVWVWSGWEPEDGFGVCFENCCAPNQPLVTSTWIFVWQSAPSGYGFTGVISVTDTDADCCPTNVLDSQLFFGVSGWNEYLWNAQVNGSEFIVEIRHSDHLGNPFAYASDHPAAGPTGPPACGTCYPTTRTGHSYYWGTAASPLCPGSLLDDGVCAAEFLWDAQLSCLVSVDEGSWGAVKNLYR